VTAVANFEDRLLIRERMSAYADALAQGDLDAYGANFVEDCIWRGMGLEYRGRKQLVDIAAKLMATLERAIYFSEVAAIHIQGNAATARTYVYQVMFLKDGRVRKLTALYSDVLARLGGDWLIKERNFEIMGKEPTIYPAVS
jgi:uncharacterized protein (TIGR02246 family)